MNDMNSRLEIQIKDLRTETKADIKELELNLTLRLGIMLAASIGIMTTLMSH